jgi:archaellum component FlaC
MRELIKELVKSLVSQLEDIEQEVDFEALHAQTSEEIGTEAAHLQQQIRQLKERLLEVNRDFPS